MVDLTSGERNIIRFDLMQRVQRARIQTVAINTEEFFNKHHDTHGRFAPSEGAMGAVEDKKKSHTVKIAGRDVSVKKIAIAAIGIVVAAGLLYVAYTKAPGTVPHSQAARHSAKLEGLLGKGGAELDSAVKNRSANIIAGRDVDRNVRDLEVLSNHGFLHQDDAAQFLKDLKKKDYTPEERDALWDYAGLFSEPDAETGIPVMGKGPVMRFHQKIIDPESNGSLTRKERHTLSIVNQAIEKNRLPRDVTLYRGLFVANADAKFYAKAKPGTVFKSPIPMFTGLTEERARPHYSDNRWPKEQKAILIRIHAKKGLPAIHSPYGEAVKGRKIPIPGQYLDYAHVPRAILKKQHYTRAPFIDQLNKEEIVLRKNQGLRILSSHKREDGVLVVDAEALTSL